MIKHNEQNKIAFSCLETRIEKQTNEFYGRFQLGFFDKYQGLTIANALRRTMLNQASSCCITGVLIENVKHEYSSLKGVKETVFDILLNLNKIVLHSKKDYFKTQIGMVFEHGPLVLKAKHLSLPSYIYCINPDQYITTLDINAKFNMTVFIDSASIRHFSFLAERYYSKFTHTFFPFKTKKNQFPNKNSNFLFLDTHFSPIRRINYKIKKSQTDKEIIFFEIYTNGSVHPSFVLKKAIRTLLISIIPFYTLKTVSTQAYPISKLSTSKQVNMFYHKKFIHKLLQLDISNFSLAKQTYRKLKKLNIFTIQDLYQFTIQNKTGSIDLSSKDWQIIQTFLHKFQLYIQKF